MVALSLSLCLSVWSLLTPGHAGHWPCQHPVPLHPERGDQGHRVQPARFALAALCGQDARYQHDREHRQGLLGQAGGGGRPLRARGALLWRQVAQLLLPARLGVEMASTGEVACYGKTVHNAFLKSVLSSYFKWPTRKRLLISNITEAFAREVRIMQSYGFKARRCPIICLSV